METIPIYPNEVNKEACEVCWTNSWQPVPGGFSCGYCLVNDSLQQAHEGWGSAMADYLKLAGALFGIANLPHREDITHDVGGFELACPTCVATKTMSRKTCPYGGHYHEHCNYLACVICLKCGATPECVEETGFRKVGFDRGRLSDD